MQQRITAVTAGGIAIMSLAAAAGSATLESLQVTRDRGRYELYAESVIAAPAEDIYTVLLEYDDNAFQRISGIYKESTYLEPDTDGTPVIYTRMEGCLLFFCKSMRRVERVETIEYRYIRTTTLPEESDFRYSISEWTFEPTADGTRMTYLLIMEPDFWVPPVVGPWFLKRTLASGGERVVQRIERIARGENMPRRLASRHE
jgi:hypothetical protein